MNKGVCMKLHHPSEHIGDAEQSLQLLREGNQRFVQGQLCDKSSYAMDREILPRGQFYIKFQVVFHQVHE